MIFYQLLQLAHLRLLVSLQNDYFNMQTMPIQSLLLVVLLGLLVWLPVVFGAYTITTAIILTGSFLLAGLLGDSVLNKNKDENESP